MSPNLFRPATRSEAGETPQAMGSAEGRKEKQQSAGGWIDLHGWVNREYVKPNPPLSEVRIAWRAVRDEAETHGRTSLQATAAHRHFS